MSNKNHNQMITYYERDREAEVRSFLGEFILDRARVDSMMAKMATVYEVYEQEISGYSGEALMFLFTPDVYTITDSPVLELFDRNGTELII
jgi:hypothetical protein